MKKNQKENIFKRRRYKLVGEIAVQQARP